MGNPCSKYEGTKEFENEFMDYLKSNNIKVFIKRIETDPIFSKELHNPSKFSTQYGPTNALGILFLENKPNFIKLLINQPLLFSEMMESFNNSKFSLINYLCERDYLKCIKIILKQTDFHAYLSINTNKRKSSSLSFNHSLIEIYIPEYSIIVAARFGSIKTIDYFYKYSMRLNEPLEDFSFETCDSKGENIELIACRTGNFILVKYLYENCKAKFKKINSNQENALIVCLTGADANHYNHFHVFKYLIEFVNISMHDCYKDLLILSKYQIFTEYIEAKLAKIGIVASKKDFDQLELKKKFQDVFLDDSETTKELFTNSFLKNCRCPSDSSVISSIKTIPESL